MRTLSLSRDAFKFLEDLQAKQFRQVAMKALSLLTDPAPSDSSQLKGHDYYRVDVGEYRIVYEFDEKTVSIILIGKRNDDEVYKALKRM